MLNSRERFRKTMNYEKPDRLPYYEFLGFWPETINRWYGEGIATRNERGGLFLDLTSREQIPLDYGLYLNLFQRRCIRNDRYRVEVRTDGVTAKVLKTNTSMPGFIDFPVKNRGDWEKIRKNTTQKILRRYPKTWGGRTCGFIKTL